MEDFLPGVLVSETGAVIRFHEASPRPVAHAAAQIGLAAEAHGALPTERLRRDTPPPSFLTTASPPPPGECPGEPLHRPDGARHQSALAGNAEF